MCMYTILYVHIILGLHRFQILPLQVPNIGTHKYQYRYMGNNINTLSSFSDGAKPGGADLLNRNISMVKMEHSQN